MQFNKTYVPHEAAVQINELNHQIYYNQVLQENCSTFPECSDVLYKLLDGESVEQLKQETKQTMSYLYSKGHRSSEITLANRREKNRERERKRQTRLKGAFNVLRSVIPDYFSEREPGDRLSRIQTLRLAKKYIASLHELLETC